jgi:hypothetical protein
MKDELQRLLESIVDGTIDVTIVDDTSLIADAFCIRFHDNRAAVCRTIKRAIETLRFVHNTIQFREEV